MGIITISRGSYSRGVEIAEKLSDKLGYECISREILFKASKDFNIPEVALSNALQDAPTILDRIKHGKKKYIAFIRKAFLDYIKRDNIVYHGMAGHFFTTGLSNVLKVRITADLEYRVKVIMKREGVDKDEARKILVDLDETRRKWSMYLYGIDTNSADLYDVVLHLDCLNVDSAVDILYNISRSPCFRTTEESAGKLNDMLIEAKVYAIVLETYPHAKVKCKNGTVLISVESYLSAEKKIAQNFTKLIMEIDGVKDVKTYVIPFET